MSELKVITSGYKKFVDHLPKCPECNCDMHSTHIGKGYDIIDGKEKEFCDYCDFVCTHCLCKARIIKKI